MKTEHHGISVVLIEENPTDAKIVRRILAAPSAADRYEVVHFECIDQATDKLDDPGVDAILIGVEVSDVTALRTLRALQSLQTYVSALPTIVLTRSTDEAFGIEAIRAGAQDCLFKNMLDGNSLSRSIRYSIERSRVRISRDDPSAKNEARHELEAWAAMCSPAPLRVTRKTFGQTSLKEAAPNIFNDLASHYLDILDHSLEERAMKTNKGVVEELKNLADRLGSLDGAPPDVVDLHMATITAKLHGQPLRKAKVYVAEGRLLLLKLMGDLAAFYRNSSWGKGSASGGKLPASKPRPIQTHDPASARNKDGK